MLKITDIKKLREETKAPVMECQKALSETKGDFAKAKALLLAWGVEKIETKTGRKTEQGIVAVYSHSNKSLGSLASVSCETDFVARTDEFKNLAHEITMQIASMNPKSIDDLLEQPYIRDPKITIEELVKQTAAKLGENIRVKEFKRMKI